MSVYRNIKEAISLSKEKELFKRQLLTYIDMNNKASILNMANLLKTMPMLSMQHDAYIGSLVGRDGMVTLYRGIRQVGVTKDNVMDSERSKGFVAMAKDIETAKSYIGGSGLLLTYHIPPKNIMLCFSVFSDVIPSKDSDEILVMLDDSVIDSCDVSTHSVNESGINRASKEWEHGSDLQRRILRMIADNNVAIKLNSKDNKHPLADILDE